jgi:hypothetical protein
MSEEAKCDCQRCGGHIAFPGEAAGQTVECPHCQCETILSAPCAETNQIVNCPCQHCSGAIEFDASELVEENSVVPCPHCGLETKLFVPQTSGSPQEKPAKSSTMPPAPLKSDANPHIYLQIKHERRGPYAKSQVLTMWNNGLITSDTLYWCEGMSDWAAVSAFVTEVAVPTQNPPTPPKISPTRTHYDAKTDTFTSTMTQMVKLAMRAIQDLGWKLDSANETLGIVNFETQMSWGSYSGVSCTLTVEEIFDNTFRVNGTGKQNTRGAQLIAFDIFGEAEGKAMKAINRMKELASYERAN